MHSTFEQFLERIRDKSLPVGERLLYASREIELTNQANAGLKRRGDTEGVKFGEEYVRVLEEMIQALMVEHGGPSKSR